MSGSFFLRTGELVYRIHTTLSEVIAGVSAIYADFLFAEEEFADFHLTVSSCFDIKHPFSRHATVRMAGGFCSPMFQPSQAMAYLEWSLNRCVFTRFFHRLILHAGVLERGGRAVVIVGESGAGKSTLSAALALSGWRLLSDELTIISTNDDRLYGLARPIALKNESIDLIRALAPQAKFGPISRATPKGDIAHLAPPLESVYRVNEPAVASSFVFVDFEAGSDLSIEHVPKSRAFMMVAEDTAINYAALGIAGFKTLANAIDSADCYILRYGNLVEAIDFFSSNEWTSRR